MTEEERVRGREGERGEEEGGGGEGETTLSSVKSLIEYVCSPLLLLQRRHLPSRSSRQHKRSDGGMEGWMDGCLRDRQQRRKQWWGVCMSWGVKQKWRWRLKGGMGTKIRWEN